MGFLFDFFVHSIFNLPLIYGFYYYHTNIISKIRDRYNENFTILVEKISEIDVTNNKIQSEVNENSQNIKKLFHNNEEDRDHITALIGLVELDNSLKKIEDDTIDDDKFDDYVHF